MISLNILFINCALQPSPELTNVEVLWNSVSQLYERQNCNVQQLRIVDLNILPGTNLHEGVKDEFFRVIEAIRQADILIVGTPVLMGTHSSQCQKLIERLIGTLREQRDAQTGQPILYNKIFGLILIDDSHGIQSAIQPSGQFSGYSNIHQCAASLCLNFSTFGCINPPNNVVFWTQDLDSDQDYLEAKGAYSIAVNRDAQLLVENSIAMAKLMHQNPLQTNIKATIHQAKSIAVTQDIKPSNLAKPHPIKMNESDPQGIYYRTISKRIWTIMQEGINRGFTIEVLNLQQRLFQVNRNNQGFVYRIYPGDLRFRNSISHAELEQEESKAHKLERMRQNGLPVPIDYGTFKRCADIPLDRLQFPLVAKPDTGSLSQHVFTDLQTVEQLQNAAVTIELSGRLIKLESYIDGRDYRVLIIANQYAGAVERRPANVVGDGKHTILELFRLRNQEPGRSDRYEMHTTLHQLVFNRTSRLLLEKAGYTLNTVLKEGEVFYLQAKIIASLGADYVDVTEQVHDSIIQFCIAVSHEFPTLTIGFDILTHDISRPLNATGGAFNEYNFLPYVDLHENCNIGQPRSVAALIWDYIEQHSAEILTDDFRAF